MRSQNASSDVTAVVDQTPSVTRSGPYKCNSHAEIVVVFKRGDRFTACPMNGGHATTWSIVRDSTQIIEIKSGSAPIRHTLAVTRAGDVAEKRAREGRA